MDGAGDVPRPLLPSVPLVIEFFLCEYVCDNNMCTIICSFGCGCGNVNVCDVMYHKFERRYCICVTT